MLQIGTKAPMFEGADENGNTIKLTDYAGKKLVLHFYPKDSTPGCTSEACDQRGANPYIPIYDKKISTMKDLLPVLEKVVCYGPRTC